MGVRRSSSTYAPPPAALVFSARQRAGTTPGVSRNCGAHPAFQLKLDHTELDQVQYTQRCTLSRIRSFAK